MNNFYLVFWIFEQFRKFYFLCLFVCFSVWLICRVRIVNSCSNLRVSRAVTDWRFTARLTWKLVRLFPLRFVRCFGKSCIVKAIIMIILHWGSLSRSKSILNNEILRNMSSRWSWNENLHDLAVTLREGGFSWKRGILEWQLSTGKRSSDFGWKNTLWS